MMSDHSVLLCIVTVVRNGEATLRDTLESVRKVTYRPMLHLVVDGNSTDRTSQMIESHRAECLERGMPCEVFKQEPRGIYAAMNFAIDKAPSDSVIHFLNADDTILSPKNLTDALNHFNDPKTDYVYSAIQVLNPDGRTSIIPPKNISEGSWVNHQALLARKKLFEPNKFNNQYGLAADSVWASKVLPKSKGAYISVPFAEVKLMGVSYNRPWKLTFDFCKYLLEEKKYPQAFGELASTVIGVAKKAIRTFIKSKSI